MDDIFEQILSSSPWVDGVPNMAVGSLEAAQKFAKMGSTMPSPTCLLGDLGNQGALCHHEQQDAFVMNDAHPDNPHAGGASRTLGIEGAEYQHSSQSRSLETASWHEPFVGNAGHFLSNTNQGKAGPYPPADGEGMHNDPHQGKRTRGDKNAIKANVNQVDEPSQANGERNAAGTAGIEGNVRPRLRARRGQATDPHSIAERNRRERIAERMKALQELVPDSNKTDKASMLDEIINYIKFLQMQVKCLSMCRLGGAAPLLNADLPSDQGTANVSAANLGQASGAACALQDGLASAERQVARLMDEDMSSAMQYLQSKGLCLMPISLATAISSSTTGSSSIRPPEIMAAVVTSTPTDLQVIGGGEKHQQGRGSDGEDVLNHEVESGHVL